MSEWIVVIFMLFFAVLAFGWFYWQRAKTRDVGSPSENDAAVASDRAE